MNVQAPFLSILVTTLATSLTACVDTVDDESSGEPLEEVDTSSASSALTDTGYVGNIPWADTTPYTTDFFLTHNVTNALDKDLTAAAVGRFPSLEGAYTSEKEQQCRDSYIWVTINQSSNGSSWTSLLSSFKVLATPAFEYGFTNHGFVKTKITECKAAYATAQCDYFHMTKNNIQVVTWGLGGDGKVATKLSEVKRPLFNWANVSCP